MHKQRDESRLPIMHVNNPGLKRKLASEMDDRLTKKKKARRIIRIIDAVLVIELGPIVKLRLIDEINGQALCRLQCKDRTLCNARSERQIQLIIEALQVGNEARNASVERRYQRNVVAKSRQSLCQCADHIRQSARFRVRMDFAARQQNSHG